MDLGFILMLDSMNLFSIVIWLFLWMSFLIVIGNIGFFIMFCFMIWVFLFIVFKNFGMYEELWFLFDYFCCCFIFLFFFKVIWWLLGFFVFLNGFDVMFFIVLDVSLFLFGF